jgi:hypothetical protein
MTRWAALLLLLGPGAALAGPNESHVGLDLYYFGQRDPGPGGITVGGVEPRGGNPFRGEGFDYASGSVDLRFAITDDVALIGNGAVGWIMDDGAHPIPDTVENAEVTSASPDLVTLDAVAGVDLKVGEWKVLPSFFYHHQKAWFTGGPNLELSRTLFEGNTVLFSNASLRGTLLRQRGYDGVKRGDGWQAALNLLVGWTQIWSPAWLTTVSAQYTRQSGRLHNVWNYVVLYDQFGAPFRLVDEHLPGVRHRGQLNLRARFSPWLAWSFGLDGSVYADSWGIYHGSVEPNLELPLFSDLQLRVWYRLSGQHGTRYLERTPTELVGYYTQDSDLGTFTTHSPGLLLAIPIARDRSPAWEARVSAFGLYRTDRVYAAGGHAGVVTRW